MRSKGERGEIMKNSKIKKEADKKEAGKGSVDMLNGKVTTIMWKMTIPMVFAMLAMVLFNLVDTIYVGRLGKDELAAISFTFPVVFFFTAITGGLGMGATSVISRTLGAGDKERAKKLTLDALLLSLTVAAISMTIGFSTIEPLFRALNVKEELFPMVKDYMEIWYFGIMVVVIPMVGNGIIRATGDTKTPMKIMLFAVTVNIILDPILIFGLGPIPKMGIRGAAIATVSARFLTMILSTWVLVRVKGLLEWKLPSPSDLWRSWKDILYVGAPNAFVNSLTPLSLAALTAIVAGFGKSAVAGYGAATRLEAFVIMPIIAFCTTLVPFIGQNFGSGRMERVDKGIKLGFRSAVIYGLICYGIIAVSAPLTARMFSSNPDVIKYYCYYIWFGGLGWIGLGMSYTTTNSFNAMGKPLPAAVITIIRVFFLILPLAFLFGALTGIKGTFEGLAAANAIAGLLGFYWLKRAFNK